MYSPPFPNWVPERQLVLSPHSTHHPNVHLVLQEDTGGQRGEQTARRGAGDGEERGAQGQQHRQSARQPTTWPGEEEEHPNPFHSQSLFGARGGGRWLHVCVGSPIMRLRGSEVMREATKAWEGADPAGLGAWGLQE